MENELITTLNFVRTNGPVSVKEISEKTGLHKLTVHRHLNGGIGKVTHQLFIREKVTEKLSPDHNGRVRGKFYFLYSINPFNKNDTAQSASLKKCAVRDPITAAFFGSPR